MTHDGGRLTAPGRHRAGRLPSGRLLVRGLLIPLLVALVATAGAPARIKIKPGDTLWEIANRYGTTVTALKRLNHLPGDTIYAGRTLLVPTRSVATGGSLGIGAEVGARRYLVRPGDTASSIAAAYRMPTSALISRNRLGAAARIRIGQVLTIPGRRVPAARARTTPAPATPVVRRYPASVTATAAAHRRELAGRPRPSKSSVRALVRRTAADLGVEQSLALAVAQQESGFKQHVVSPADAIGVMQVLPSTARWLSSEVVGRRLDLLDVEDNVLAGVALLRQLTRAAPLPQAIAGYYQGLASVRRNGMYRDTKQYVNSVLALRQRWR